MPDIPVIGVEQHNYISRLESASIFGSSEKGTKAKQNPRTGELMQTNAGMSQLPRRRIHSYTELYHPLREKILHFFPRLHSGVGLHVSASVCLFIGYIYEFPPSPYGLVVPHTHIIPLHVRYFDLCSVLSSVK